MIQLANHLMAVASTNKRVLLIISLLLLSAQKMRVFKIKTVL